MKKIFVLTAALGTAVTFFAQTRMLTSDQLMTRSLYPSIELRNIQFVGNGSQLAYTHGDTLFVGSAKRMRPRLSLSQLNQVLSLAHQDTLMWMPELTMLNESELQFQAAGSLMHYDMERRTLKEVVRRNREYRENLDVAPQTSRYAYTDGSALIICDAEGGELKTYCDRDSLNGDIEPGVVYGQSVHRNEFGIEKGTFWSPKGTRLAFYRMDQRMVTQYPIVNTAVRVAEEAPIYYPMAGMKSHEVTVGVYDCDRQKTVYLHTRQDTSVGEREAYLTNVTWSPDEKYLYIAKLNREQNHMVLECYDAETGLLSRRLFEERNARYVEPCDGLHFLPKADDEFLWLSRRDGYNHVYRYRTDGTLVGQLTHGDFEVSEIIGFDARGRYVFLYANKESVVGRYAYKVDLATGEMTLMTPEHGTHSVTVSRDGGLIIDRYSNTETPCNVVVAATDGRLKRLLYQAENPLADYAMPGIRIGTLKASDAKTDLYYRMITPPGLDSSRRYPTIVYVYGGPHSQLVTDSWLAGANLYFMYLAQQGYVVFTLDNRGTSNRGFEFESCIHRHLGDIQLADQMEGVYYLSSLPFVDTDRMGVEGWSFGGFMTITMKLAHPEVFKVACAGGPVIDWKWYEIMYGERYMDTPQENPEGYAAASLIGKADRLQGRLLVIHGAEDPVVMWQNSLEFIDACIDAGRQVDYFVYPHHQHNVLGRDRLHLFAKMFDYYETFLK